MLSFHKTYYNYFNEKQISQHVQLYSVLNFGNILATLKFNQMGRTLQKIYVHPV